MSDGGVGGVGGVGGGTAALGARERLIEEVRRAPLLWDTRHELHRDHEARDRQWADIAQRLHSDSETLKREWKILRDSMRQSLRAARRGGGRGGGGGGGGGGRGWRHHARMAFLLPHISRRPAAVRRALEDADALQGALEAAREGAGAGVGPADDADALELFFASVCAAARGLPPAARRRLQRSVLDALLAAETDHHNIH